MPEELTLTQALEKIKTYEAKFTKMDSDLTGLQTYVAEAKKAEADEEKKKEKEEKEAKVHMAEAKKALKAIEEESDPDKIRKAIKEAAKYMKAEADEEEEEEKEEKKDKEEKTAKTLKHLTAMITKPKIQILNAAYKSLVTDEKLKQFNANWINMEVTELDEELEKVKPFIGNTISETQHPLGFSTEGIPESFHASTDLDNSYSAKVDEMPLEQLFGGRR